MSYTPEQAARVTEAVLYAMRCGCFFPVPNPEPPYSVEQLSRWGAMRNLHSAVAELASPPPRTEGTPIMSTDPRGPRPHTSPIAPGGEWRLVFQREGDPHPGEWVETDHPAVIAAMGSRPPCVRDGCQLERQAPRTEEPR